MIVIMLRYHSPSSLAMQEQHSRLSRSGASRPHSAGTLLDHHVFKSEELVLVRNSPDLEIPLPVGYWIVPSTPRYQQSSALQKELGSKSHSHSNLGFHRVQDQVRVL